VVHRWRVGDVWGDEFGGTARGPGHFVDVPGGRGRKLVVIEEFARVRLGFQADDTQAEVLRSASKRGILNCSRQ